MLKYNERAWAIDVISHINSIASNCSCIKRAGGELSLRGNGQALFPDVLLFGGSGIGEVLQGWELKMPDTSIDDIEFIENAREKAVRLGLNSFILCNVTEMRLYVLNDNGYVVENKFTPKTTSIVTREDVYYHSEIWKSAIEEAIKQLDQYFFNGQIKGSSPDVVFSDNALIKIALECQADVKDHLERTAKSNIKVDAQIKIWWKSVKNEYPGYASPFAPLAYVVILRWFNKIIFANILCAYGKINKDNPIIPAGASVVEAIESFNKISEKVNYWNIIGSSDFDVLLPDSSWGRLCAINSLIKDYDFSSIDKNILDQIIKSTVLFSIKKTAGLFCTPNNLAELLVRVSLWDKSATVIDPFCGTGTIVKNIVSVMGEYNVTGNEIVKNVWASDKFSFPVQIANLVVASSETIDRPLRIFTHDAFSLFEGKEINFVNPKNGETVAKNVPLFSSIISNLPFVRFEDIAELNSNVLQSMDAIYSDFGIPKKDRLEGRSDLYCYIPFVLWRLLIKNGVIGIIISNSWMSTKAGIKFQNLLVKFYDIEVVVASAKGRWFPDADVVANILVLRKKEYNTSPDSNTVFVSTKINIHEFSEIDDVALDINSCNAQSELINIQVYKAENLTKIQKMGLGLNSCFGNCKWLLENINSFVHASSVASIERGERRGWDPLFYPNSHSVTKIEPNYLKKVCKNAKEFKRLDATPQSYAFCCDKTKDELLAVGDSGALHWIVSFEDKLNGKNKPLKKVLEKPGLKWYEMPSTALATFALSMNPDRKIYFFKFDKPSFVNQRLIRISPKKDIDVDLMHAVLNSIFVISQVEALGFGRGLGVLDINSTSLKRGLYIPNMSLIGMSDRTKIVQKFCELKKISLVDTVDMVESVDWIEFNNLIAASIGIEENVVNDAISHFKRLYSIRKAITA